MTELPPLESVLDAHARWCARREGGARADLRQRRMRKLDLSGRVLAEAVLRDADLTGAVLCDTDLTAADLRFASLREADLRGANLSRAQLDFASLDGADLGGARFRGATLRNASLENVRMSWFDHTLLAEQLERAAAGDLELRMVAAFVGRTASRCWDDYRELEPRHRRWMLQVLGPLQRDGDDAPVVLQLPAAGGPPRKRVTA
jgi:pentapeptide repeat protein